MADFTSREEVRSVYRRRARNYDTSANLYYLIGVRERAYRKKAIASLRLGPGDTVVEIGCGTGLNFSLIQERIGPNGRIIGVDLTDSMLDQARRRINRHSWKNVELIESDADSYGFPQGINGILSTFALTLEPEFDDVIRRGASALRSGGRMVVADLKLPNNWLRRLAPFLVLLVRPFAVSMEIAEQRHPWESMARHFADSTMDEFFFGIIYIASGTA